MSNIEEKLKTLLGERETIVQEMNELKQAFDIRQQRLIEVVGSIKTLQELLSDKDVNNDEKNTNTTKKIIYGR